MLPLLATEMFCQKSVQVLGPVLLNLHQGNIWTINNESPKLDKKKKGREFFLVIIKQMRSST